MIKIERMDEFARNRKYPPTPPQWQAISITGADVLVAAAAGSGKTEVLSERIARKVARDRWDIDKLLVLTFTTAAAKNMLVRIENKISERLLATNLEEDRIFLRKQRMLMNSAQVTTIDSFCLSVLKKFYYLVEEEIDNEKKYLSPNFNVLPNSKGFLVDAINEVLEFNAKENPEITDSLFTVFGDKKSIVSSIQDIYYKLLTIPNFEKYLEENFLGNINDSISNFVFYKDSILEDFQNLESLTKSEDIKIAHSFVKFLKRFFSEYSDGTLESILNNSQLDITKKEKLRPLLLENTTLFGSAIENIEELTKIESYLDEQLLIEDNIYNAEKLEYIYTMLESYSNKFKVISLLDNFSNSYYQVLVKSHKFFVKKKRQSNFLDFSDLNHLAIKALTKIENNKIVPSEAAEYYKNTFLEIYVDEYQDNNNLQEYILNLIRGNDINFFRVGDVKQAIYGFRGSNPDLFEEKYNSYTKLVIEDYSVDNDYSFESNRNGICVVLKENFRSDENILKSSNYIFNRLMKDKNAGVSYEVESALYYPSAKEPTKENISTKLLNGQINYFTQESVEDKKLYRKQSIENIAFEILKGIEQGNKFSDYAILLRNSTKMLDYKEVFDKYNIPLYFKEKIGFTSSNCFNLLYNLFNFLDNTNREASLIAVLHSEIFDYSNDELLNLSLNTGKNIFEKLKASKLEKDKQTVSLLNKWINFSLNHSLVDLLERIATDIDLVNYLSMIGINSEEVDYYENFLDVVKDYQNLDNKLSGLIKHLKNIKVEEVFETKKKTPNNSVTLSTIHISKGLEYKYVFVADLDTSFSKRGYSGEVLFTEDFGFSVNVEDLAAKYGVLEVDTTSIDTLYKLNSSLIKMREREEEVRNLYVALTRAEKVLYLVSPNGIELNHEKSIGLPLSRAILEEDNFEKILTIVLASYKESDEEENELGANFENYVADEVKKEISSYDSSFNLEEFYKNFGEKNEEIEEVELESKLISNKIFPAKTSYSALKKLNSEANVEKNKTKKEEYLELATLSKTTSASKAIMRGNIVHKLFERIVKDIRNGEMIDNISSYLENLLKSTDIVKNIKERRILSEEEYGLVNNRDDIEKITNFINSPLIKVIKEADECQTEVAFTTAKSAKELYKDSESSSDVILQGVVDLLVKIDSKNWIIVDYKTDNITKTNGEKILEERHKEQLRIYKEAVESYYKIKNVKTFIYSYTLSSLIEVKDV